LEWRIRNRFLFLVLPNVKSAGWNGCAPERTESALPLFFVALDGSSRMLASAQIPVNMLRPCLDQLIESVAGRAWDRRPFFLCFPDPLQESTQRANPASVGTFGREVATSVAVLDATAALTSPVLLGPAEKSRRPLFVLFPLSFVQPSCPGLCAASPPGVFTLKPVARVPPFSTIFFFPNFLFFLFDPW